MQSSSLIFVVVVAIWAAYLVQYWVRRRDHLATIRSVDRFSAAMRVLDSHRLSQTAEPARSYAVSPTRAASPQVVVKRGVAAPEVTVPEPVAHPSEGRPSIVSAVVDAPRKVRGLAFLGHLVLLPLSVLVAALGPLPWLVPGLLLLGFLGSFGWLRQDVKAAEATRREEHLARRRAREASAPVRRQAPVARQAARPARADVDDHEVADDLCAPPRVTGDLVDDSVVTVTDAPFDVADEPVVEAEPVPAQPVAEVAPDERAGTWKPVPVPRPTYTMKARAGTRPAPTQAPADVPQVLDAIEDDVVAPRRVVGG
ncbi:hypothetical protein JNO54_04415 [Janibacter sp. YIM B02568]|uniref:hypothetical protein n=1 Tax=Janibacter endophyticus TaxID=2806261 RepID=UPI00194E4AC3|nr:hypothetical protein [Janibacter endophyticus]MBM6545385.1 hypothetical protein [Janibacter endophyticus]